MIKNKARLVAQGHTQEEGIDYDEVFTHVARIEAIWLFSAYASFMGFMVYQMDVKSAFLYKTIEEEVYVCQPLGFEDPDYPDKVFRNKKDEKGIVVRNKAQLVARGHTQEEGIDYEELFAPVARIEAIRFFLAYAFFMGLMVYQMDVKSAFLYETIEKEVYVWQPPGFEDPNYDDKKNGFQRGKIDQTLFIKKQKGVRNLSDEFEEFSVNNTNEVSVASTPVTVVGPNSTNSTNSFNVAGPSDNAVSPTFKIGGKSLFVDPSQYPDDPNMPALEDIVYSDDEDDVGA
nr:hypothetical protein [Tanacetum cinerariifolium]